MEYCSSISMPICTECKHAVEIGGVVRHLRSVHQVSQQEADRALARLTSDAASCKKADPWLKEAYIGSAAKGKPSILPVLPQLPILACFKCRNCSYMAVSMNTFKKHYGKNCAKEGGSAPRSCQGQTLFSGNKTKYFEVSELSEDCGLLKRVVELEGSKPSRAQEADVSRMDPYLSELRFDLHLERLGISLEESFEVSKWTDGNDSLCLRKCLCRYMKRAFDVTRRKVHVQAHRFFDAPLQLALQEETFKRYVSRLSRFTSFLVKVSRGLCPAISEEITRETKDAMLTILSGKLTESEELKTLHEVFWTSFFEPLRDGQQCLPIFLTCSSVMGGRRTGNEKMRFGSAVETSPMLASLKYLARCVVVTQVYIECSAEERVEKGWQPVEAASSSNADSGVAFVAYCMKKSNMIRAGETSAIRFIVCPHHSGCGIVDGVELSLRTLGRRMKDLQKIAWEIIRGRILQGFAVPSEFWEACSMFQDNLTDRSPGYWFGMHSANYNVLQIWRKLYVAHMRANLFDKTEKPCQEQCIDFLDACEELQKIMVGLLQTCSGAPGRATEVSVLQVCNTDLAPRNVFISQGRIFFTCSYHKGRAMNEGVGKPVARFPDAATSGLLFLYLVIVRPLETAVVDMLFDKGATEHRDFLFASRGSFVDGTKLREWFQTAMRKVDIPLGTNQYRHFYVGAVKHLLKGEDGMEIDSNEFHRNEFLVRQAGHAPSTAHRIYGVGSSDMRQITGFELEAFRKSSETWLSALGIEFGRPREVEKEENEVHRFEEKEDIKRDVDRFRGLEQRLNRRLDRLESLVEKVLAALEKKSEVRVEKRERVDEEDNSKSKKIRLSLLDGLRRFLGQESAEFRSAEQREAVRTAVEGKEDSLVVLPTGSGKSLTFMMAAMMSPDKVCVVIVPLLALQLDMVRRCEEAGLQATAWSGRKTAGTRIVFVSVEHVCTTEYEAFILELAKLRRLHCVFVDEAHLCLTSADFRPSFETLWKKIRPKGVECAIIAQTATCPPNLVREVGRACGLSEGWRNIRSGTTRSNLRYRVVEAEKEEFSFVVLEQVRRVFEKRQKEEVSRVIVYGSTREMCEELFGLIKLCLKSVECFAYHAGLPSDDRRSSQKEWESRNGRKGKVMVATNAFGCGIDVACVRSVIHAGQPRRLIDFLQESGRAGRDGNTAESTVVLVPGTLKKGEDDERLGFTTWMQDPTRCRRREIDEYADGIKERRTCQARGMEACDVCSGNGQKYTIPDVGLSAGVMTKEATRNVLPSSGSQRPTPPANVSLGTPSTGKSGNKTMSRGSEGSLASVQELQSLCGKVSTLCPVCSVVNRAEVHHETTRGCCVGRCLKCGLKGHDFKDCLLLKVGENERVCFACSIGMYRGEVVHLPGTYGKWKKCYIRKLMSICALAWADSELREEMRNGIEGLKEVGEHPQAFGRWLRGSQGTAQGVGIAAGWVMDNVIHRGFSSSKRRC